MAKIGKNIASRILQLFPQVSVGSCSYSSAFELRRDRFRANNRVRDHLRHGDRSVIPGATLTIHNTGTGIDKVVPTNDVGLYSAPFVQPGSYEITASKQGFARVSSKIPGRRARILRSISASATTCN
jgi:hypothetical protein